MQRLHAHLSPMLPQQFKHVLGQILRIRTAADTEGDVGLHLRVVMRVAFRKLFFSKRFHDIVIPVYDSTTKLRHFFQTA